MGCFLDPNGCPLVHMCIGTCGYLKAKNITATEIEERFKSPAYRFTDAGWEPLLDAILALARKHCPMDTITISGYTFTVPTPFATGHTCTEAEANVLNRALHANLRRNFARRVHEVLEEFDTSEERAACMCQLQRDLDGMASEYQFGGPDPVSAEALVIAEQIVRQSLRARKLNVTDYTKAQLIDQAETLLAGPQGSEIRALAETRTKMIRNAAAKELARVVGEGR